MCSSPITTEVSINPIVVPASGTRGGILAGSAVQICPEALSVDRHRALEGAQHRVARHSLWRRTGVSSPTGTPRRVTTKLSPESSAQMISPLLRSSRYVTSRVMTRRSTSATHRASDARIVVALDNAHPA
jgi:hypothetical protein